MAKYDPKSILVFSDGACSGNPGPGGWGAIISTPEGEVTELGAADRATTNNRMELSGAIAALRHLQSTRGEIHFYTDSTYVIRGITQWIWGWMKNGWKNGDGNEVLNRDLWSELFRYVSERSSKEKNLGKVSWHYSRGHVGTPGNERCDEIAVAFSKQKWVDLYSGTLLKYAVPIFDLPEDSSLPEMRPREEKKAAYSYLSYLNGEVYRHSDWASCERRVKGRSGAKFKKAMSQADELQILQAWGLPASTSIKN
jgi:ribonuclease HI